MKLHIRRQPMTLNVEFFLFEDEGKYLQTYNFTEKGDVVVNTIERKPGEGIGDLKPLVTIPEFEARLLLTAFADAAFGEGIENKTYSFYAGELEATKKHLYDMRKLMKLA